MNNSGTEPGISETCDAFLGGRLQLFQPATGYRAGTDAMLLAAAYNVMSFGTVRVLDCGAGAGAVGLALATRVEAASVVLVERDPCFVALARRNVTLNRLADRVDVVEADVAAPLSACPSLLSRAGTFDHVLANPPYFEESQASRAASRLKRAAHTMRDGEYEDWARFAAAMLRPQGGVTLIVRVEMLTIVLAAMTRRFGAVRILPLQSNARQPASRLLINAIKGSRGPLALLPALIVHDNGLEQLKHGDRQRGATRYSAEVEQILRYGAALSWPKT